MEKYAKATCLSPTYAYAFSNWGVALYTLAKIKKDNSLFEEAMEKYGKATYFKQGFAKAFNNWGNALSELAESKKDESLFKEAFEKYAQAINNNSNYVNAFNNWRAALVDFAKIEPDEMSFETSFDNFCNGSMRLKVPTLSILKIMVMFRDVKKYKILDEENLCQLLKNTTDWDLFFVES